MIHSYASFRWILTLIISGFLSAPLLTNSLCASASELAALPLLNQTSIRYRGSFTAPVEDGNGHPLTWGGYAISYDPIQQGLFIGCHDHQQHLGEITIPAITNPPQMASILQNCADVTEGRLPLIDDYLPRLGGTLSYNGRLIISGYGYYDADYSQTRSHFSSTPILSQTGDIAGPYQVGTGMAGMVAGYMTTIPEEWRQAFNGPALTGQCCISIISRSSAGPAVSVFNPDQVGSITPVPSTTVLAYPIDHPLAPPESQNYLFNLSTQIMGVAFPPGTRSVLFFGRHGTGPYCYDTGAVCGDPADPYKGPHAYPISTRSGPTMPMISLPSRMAPDNHGKSSRMPSGNYREWTNTGSASIMGATYDPASGRLFFTEMYEDTPTIHVYQIDPPVVDTTPPLLYNGSPSGKLPLGTRQAVLSVTSNENATCRFSTVAGTPFPAMTNTFTNTGNTVHHHNLTNLHDEQTYSYFVRCRDENNNFNTMDYLLSFRIAQNNAIVPPLFLLLKNL